MAGGYTDSTKTPMTSRPRQATARGSFWPALDLAFPAPLTVSMEFQVVIPPGTVERFRKEFEAIGQSHVRAGLFAMNGVARDAQRELLKMLPKFIDKPAPYTMRAIKFKTTPLDVVNLADAETRVFVLNTQSAYLKYLLEGGMRLPDDIGPADDDIYGPLWENLKRIEGITATNVGSIARRTLYSFSKRAGRDGGKPAKARGTRGEIFYGAPRFGGSPFALIFGTAPKDA